MNLSGISVLSTIHNDYPSEDAVEKLADIIDVSDATFQTEVIEQSKQAPVVVDFWAPWCGPCRMLGPTLEKLAGEARGAWRLAKLNVDENQRLAARYGVQGIPAVKAFRDGKVVNEFVGAQPEPKVREFLQKIAPSEGDRVAAEASRLLAEHRWAEAEIAYRRAVSANRNDGTAALGLLKALLAQGKGAEADRLIATFPPGREAAEIERYRPLVRFLLETQCPGEPGENLDLEARYRRAGCLVTENNLQGAMDGLLEVLRRDKRYRGDEPRLLMLALFDLLGDADPLTREYRARLASVLF
jgi:putative thioredoxin